MVTEAKHQSIEPNTAPRLLTDREGELASPTRLPQTPLIFLYAVVCTTYGSVV
jgi:hypothetical protein